MTKGKKGTPANRRSANSRRRPRSAGVRRRLQLSPAAQEVENAWDDLKTELRRYAQANSDDDVRKELSPYCKPESVIKRSIYKFVRSELRKDKGKVLDFQKVIEHNLLENRPIHISFEDNPFHWAMYDFIFGDDDYKFNQGGDEKSKSKRYKVSRYGRYLQYAWRHEVPSRYLIGFLYQVGEAEVYRKAKDSEAYESWYFPLRAKREAKSQAESSE